MWRTSGATSSGRRPDEFPELTPATRDFADIWREADKVVYSRTLDAVSTERTRLEREFDSERCGG
jgi:hypothetical protein